ncbi:hypothetical protein IJI31_01915 [bacterium]|nr:hypothetical protein [bacterium]
MSTQNLSAYNLSYDPYLAQQLNTAVNAAKAGNVSPTIFPTQATAATSSAQAVSQETLREYERQIAEIEKLQQESQKGAIYEEDGRQYQIQSDGYVATDGKNDGKISFGQKLKNLGKGVVKTFTGMFTDKNGKFSLKQTLKSVAIAGACIAASAILPGVGSALVYAGLALGTAGLVKNGVKAAKATTDQEAEQAWQGIGTSGTIVAMSLYGVKQKGAAANAKTGAVKEKGIMNSIKGIWSDTRAGFSEMNTDIASAVGKFGNGYMSEVGNNVATKIFNKKDWAELKDLEGKEMWKSFRDNVRKQALERLGGKSKYVENSKKSIDDQIAKLQEELAQEGIEPSRAQEIDWKIQDLKDQKAVYDVAPDRVSSEIESNQKQLDQYKNDLKSYKEHLKNAKDANSKNFYKNMISETKSNIKEVESLISEYNNYDAWLNDRVLKMASKNFEFQHPTKLGQYWALTKPTIGLSSNTNIVAAEAVSNLTSEAPTMASLSPEEAAAANQQSQAQLEAQKQALQQEYQAMAQMAQYPQANPAVLPSAQTPVDIQSPMIMQNWYNQYRV